MVVVPDRDVHAVHVHMLEFEFEFSCSKVATCASVAAVSGRSRQLGSHAAPLHRSLQPRLMCRRGYGVPHGYPL